MSKKIGGIVLTWFAVIFVYIIIASAMPALLSITGTSAADMQVSSNMTNYPGMLAAVESFPVYVWFIPGGVGFVATVVFLRRRDT